MSESRDPVELLPSDAFAFAKRTSGFVPMTIFYEEETGNLAAGIPLAFFQDFSIGLSPQEAYRSIDEAMLMEITLSDLRAHDEGWLFSNGYYYPADHRYKETEWIPLWPPMLHLVESEPEWRSTDFEEDIKKREVRRQREDAEAAIASACPRCAAKRDVWLMTVKTYRLAYVHVKEPGRASLCHAHELHDKRGTISNLLDDAVALEVA